MTAVVPVMSPVMGLSVRGPFSGSGYEFNFGGALPPGVTLARASTGWYFDSAGVLQSAANDVPRFTYDPATLALQGVLVEPARTNSIRNNTIVGAVAGSPGTLPTNWSVNGATGSTRTLALATDYGIETLSVTYTGTAGGNSSSINLDEATVIAASTGQTWTLSAYLKLLSGDFTNITTAVLRIEELDGSGAVIGSSLSTVSIRGITSAALRTQRFQVTRTLTEATVAYVRSRLLFTHPNGSAISLGFAIGQPQLAQGSSASSPIKTTSAAVTRAADVLSLAMTDGTYDIDITRLSGVTNVVGAVVSGGAYTVPTDLSPLQSVVARRVA